MRLGCDSRGFSFFAVIVACFIIGAVFGCAVFFFAEGDGVISDNLDYSASGFIPILIGLAIFPLAAFFIGFSASGIVLLPILSAVRGFSAAICAAGVLRASGFGSEYWFFFIFSAASCAAFIAFSYLAFRSSLRIIQKLLIPEARSSSGFGEYIKSSALLFAVIFAMGALDFFSAPMIF